jgi:hypothetical protein
MNYLLTFGCVNGSAHPYLYSRYDTEKERRKLMKRAQQDAQNNPNAKIWVIDVTGDGGISHPLEAE